jgi:hypothetical protein
MRAGPPWASLYRTLRMTAPLMSRASPEKSLTQEDVPEDDDDDTTVVLDDDELVDLVLDMLDMQQEARMSSNTQT